MDEGHYFSANNTSSTIRVAKNLVKVDHRWVVSGTPAKDLLGVEIDQASADSQDLSTQRKTFDSKHDVAGAVDSINALASNFLMSTPWKVNDAKNYIYRQYEHLKTSWRMAVALTYYLLVPIFVTGLIRGFLYHFSVCFPP